MLDDLLGCFRDPPAELRTMPQWSWNGELHEARITRQLEDFARNGCGGVFPHARPGLITPYLSSDWFEMWGHGMREAKRLGLQFHIYDEFCCPGGHAGGHVIARKPHLVQQVLALAVVTGSGARLEGRPVAYFRRDVKDGTVREVGATARDSASPEAPLLVLLARAGEHRPRKGGFGMPDMLQRETAETFIETTHARYAEQFGDEFGRTVRFVFCDEPQIYGSRDAWPYSPHLLREFRREHGYELDEALGALCFGGEGATAVRFDYWRTVNRLFNESFMKPLHDWCEAHGLLFTGHLMENTWPRPRLNPDCMSSLRWMQAPGTDLLGFQFSATAPADNGLYFLNQKEVASVAAQLGRRWIVTESCGARGYHASFELFKPCEDYLLALGVNVMDPHLCHETLSGSRKYDWPQTLSDHSPWWRHYRPHADHVARTNAALSRGVERNRVLVLQPTTTAWLHYAPGPFRSGAREDPLEASKDSQTSFLLALYGAQVDFDLGDEFILEEFGRAEDGLLIVGERTYELVVVPPAIENWTGPTARLIGDFLAAGGRVVGGQQAPTHVDGRPDEEPSRLLQKHSDRWVSAPMVEQMVSAVREAVLPRITGPDGEALPSALCWRRVELAEGSILYFLCNPWREPLNAAVRLESEHGAELDTTTGEATALRTEAEGTGRMARLVLPPHGHALWLCSDDPLAIPEHVAVRDRHSVALKPAGTERLAPNLLFLDYCDLVAEGERFEDVNTLRADGINWRLQGFAQNPWQGAHQFERTIIDRPVPSDSGFSVTYRFAVSGDLSGERRSGLKAGVERPWLYGIEMNGRPIDQAEAEPWFDEHMRALPIGPLVHPGENALTLTAEPFHMLCEIMPVYLFGDFALRPISHGFELAAPAPLRLGDWTSQGLPFYPDALRYSFAFRLAEVRTSISLVLGSWAGSVATASIDSADPVVVYPHMERVSLPGPFAAGDHELAVDVYGNMRNMMGPHHAEGLPGPWTWIQCPEHMPPGGDYTLQPSGLHGVPRIEVL